MKRILSCCMILVLLLAGCSSKPVSEESSSSVSETSSGTESSTLPDSSETSAEDPDDGIISVYYVKDLGVISYLLEDAEKRVAEEMTLEIREFADYPSMKQAIDTEGMPDLVLLDETYADSDIRLEDWIAEGKIADLSPLIAADREAGELLEEDFFPGTFTIGEIGGGIYCLPLSLKTYFGVTTQNNYDHSELGALDPSYSLLELTDALAREKTLHEEDYLITLPSWVFTPGPEYLLSELLMETGAVQIDPSSGELIVDETGAAALASYMDLLMADQALIAALPKTAGLGELEALYLMGASNMNLVHQTRYWQSAYGELLEESLKLVFFPDCASPEAYGAMANMIGVVGSKSLEKGTLAYHLMRAMMDLPASTWLSLNIGDVPNILGPVSKVIFAEELEAFAGNYGARYKLQYELFDRQPLGETEIATLSDWASKVQLRPLPNASVLEYARELLSRGGF